MTASSPNFAATDNASAGPTVSGLRSPMIESSIFLPGPFIAERPVMMSHVKRDVLSASPFRLRAVNATALAGSAVRIDTRGVDARRAARSAARNSSVFRIISVLLAYWIGELAACTTRRMGFGRCKKEGYAVGVTGRERGTWCPDRQRKLFNYAIGTGSQGTRWAIEGLGDQRLNSRTSDSARSG